MGGWGGDNGGAGWGGGGLTSGAKANQATNARKKLIHEKWNELHVGDEGGRGRAGERDVRTKVQLDIARWRRVGPNPRRGPAAYRMCGRLHERILNSVARF